MPITGTRAAVVHHTWPVARGGPDADAPLHTLEALCPPCAVEADREVA